jgi:hypothetical protein
MNPTTHLWLSLMVVGCQAGSSERALPARATVATARSSRSVEQIRREGNHLVGSGSAYLTAHSHNPVDWYSWGPEALTLATKLDRPIFLSIGYVSCHWCHVMEKEVFEQDDVAEFLNAHFISIKVDREERPDLDAAYMAAVEALTGSGGWPMTAFLTPSLRPFFGGTYLPHQAFLQAIRAAEEEFRTARNELEERGANVYRRILSSAPVTQGRSFSADELHGLARRSLASVDATHGGFQSRTKFPTPIKWRFLLDAHRKWPDPEIASALRKTLDAMANGGIHDQIGGGFFRYATEPTWTIPHFEKMLYDNAQLATLYLEAAAAFDEPRYRAIAEDTLDFLLRDMRAPEKGFGASFDADTAGKEGSTYLWTRTELGVVLGDDAAAAATFLGVTDAGNFEGSNVPTARLVGSAESPDSAHFRAWRPKLLAARQRRAQPSFDAKMVTAWNGLAVGALATGYRVSGDERFLKAAEETAAALWTLNHRPNGELARASDTGKAGSPAVLDDYAALAGGLLDLFEATSKALYLERAVSLTTDASTRFENPAGGWFLTSGDAQEPLGRKLELDDGVEPSGNAAMIAVLERLAALTGRDDFGDAARRAIARYADIARERGLDMAGWLDGALLDEGPFYEVVIAGPRDSLSTAYAALLPAWATGVRVPKDGAAPDLVKSMPDTAEKRARGSTSVAYVCVHGACKSPTSDPAVLRRQLLTGWAR